MILVLVVDGVVFDVVAPAGVTTRASLVRQVQGWMTRGELFGLNLAAGGEVLVNFRTVRTVEVREPAAG